MKINDHDANILFYRFRLVRRICPKCRKGMENFLKASYGFIFLDIFVIFGILISHSFLVTLIILQDIVTTDHASDAS